METEKCSFCGALVRKEKLKGHYETVHPKRAASLESLSQPSTRSTSVFKSHRRRNITVLALVVLAVIGISYAASEFAKANTMQMHWHPVLSATINGSSMTIPANIGTPQGPWADHSLDQYGMQGMSPLHTHETDGKIHEESNTVRDFTLQEFLAIWGQRLDPSQVLGHPVDPSHRAYIVVDGVEQPASTLDVVLGKNDTQKIQIVCGP